MSDLVLFCIGVVVFAITVYGAVMAGGLAFTRKQFAESEELRKNLDDESHVPLIVKY